MGTRAGWPRGAVVFGVVLSLLLVACGGNGGGGDSGGGGGGTVPTAPTGFVVVAGNSEATATWDAVSGATSYNLYMATTPGVTKSNYSTLANGMKHEGVTSPFTHTGLTNGIAYYFVLTAVNVTGESTESPWVSATPSDVNSSVAIFSMTTWEMTAARSGHTATLLSNGKVLIVGGVGDIPGTAEIYGNGTFTATGRMTASRISGHTATLLPNGKVLVAGGASSGAGASAEIYDPATGTFSATGSMTVARSGHTATLLSNGKVLMAGGIAGGSTSAELYDPSTNTFTATGSMTGSRYRHTATPLPSGEILIAGGSYLAALSTAEVYDPVTGIFSAIGGMTAARSGHTATSLSNGTVLIVGGNASSGAELYDPATGLFTTTGTLAPGTLAVFRYAHTATLLTSGKVLVAGGLICCAANPGNSPVINSAAIYGPGSCLLEGYCLNGYPELYDPDTGTFTATGQVYDNFGNLGAIGTMNDARYDHTATLLPNGQVLIAGGSNNSGTFGSRQAISAAERYRYL